MIITVSHTISMGHRLPSYDGICNSLHGHNVRFEVSVETGDVFYDFKVLKDHLIHIIRDFDHALVLHTEDPLLPLIQGAFRTQRFVVLNVEPTTETIAQYVFDQLRAKLGRMVTSVKVHETDKYSATCVLGMGTVQRL